MTVRLLSDGSFEIRMDNFGPDPTVTGIICHARKHKLPPSASELLLSCSLTSIFCWAVLLLAYFSSSFLLTCHGFIAAPCNR